VLLSVLGSAKAASDSAVGRSSTAKGALLRLCLPALRTLANSHARAHAPRGMKTAGQDCPLADAVTAEGPGPRRTMADTGDSCRAAIFKTNDHPVGVRGFD
jgi:hypothetical protein